MKLSLVAVVGTFAVTGAALQAEETPHEDLEAFLAPIIATIQAEGNDELSAEEKALVERIYAYDDPDAAANYLWSHPDTQVQIFAAYMFIERVPMDSFLRDLASQGRAMRALGPTVSGLLKGQDWDLRVAAAKTLGHLQDAGATDALIACLDEEDDWRLVNAAAQSLGRLKAETALPALEAIAEYHWFPYVRRAAAKAIRVIQRKDAYPVNLLTGEYEADDFFEGLSYLGEDVPRRKPRLNPITQGEPEQLSEADLALWDYKIEMYWEGSEEIVSVRPQCGIRAPGGSLVASNRGEWGGELVYLAENQEPVILAHTNTVSIHRFAGAYVGVTGLAHIFLNTGNLYRIEFAADGTPHAKRWKVLPGAPRTSSLLANGSLFVDCTGGAVVVSPEGDIAMATPENVGMREE